jgi:hypothetical protein
MGKDHKIIFNLTIKDLKDLGIIKKRRKNKNKYYINKYGKKIKIPYSNSSSKIPFGEEVKTPNLSQGQTFTNSTTINDDTNRLRNELALQELNDRKNKPSLTDDLSNYMNPKLLQITNDLQNERIRNDMENEKNRFAMKFLYDNMQSNRFEKPTQPASTFYNPVYEPYIQPNNYAKLDDGVDTSTTAGSESFINSNIAPDSKVMDDTKSSIIGDPPITPTTQPLYSIFDNVVTDLDNLLAPTPTPKPNIYISNEDEELLNALSDKKPPQELKDMLSNFPTPKRINMETPAFLKGIFKTPSATMNADTETDMRFQPELDNLIPLNQKMGGGMNMNEELKLEKPKTPEPEPEPEPEQPLIGFDQMIEEMKFKTARQRQYLKERKEVYKALADRKGEPHKPSIVNSVQVQKVTEAINELNKKPDVVIKAKRGQKKNKN